MTDPGRLTVAQIQARTWLPEDGSWRVMPGKLTMALNSLSRVWPGCLEAEWGKFGVRGGEGYRWRLTPKGMTVNKLAGEQLEYLKNRRLGSFSSTKGQQT